MSRSEDMAPKPGMVGGVAGQQLQSIIDRIERLEEEKKAIADDIKDVYAESKGNGFDTKTIRKIIALRKLSQEERDEAEATLDIYMAALGMLAGTPLGQAAIKKLSPQPPEPTSAPDDDEAEDEFPSAEPERDPEPQVSIDDARRMGGEAAAAGKPVTSNPFGAYDIRRAAWDEGWCAHTGTDGMAVPESWRRRAPKKPDEDGKAA